MSWIEQPKNVTRLYRGLWAVGLLLVAADFIVHRHAEVGFDDLFGFHGAYGFLACVGLVFAAKLLRRAVMRPEDFYDR
jgi:hypothetical protein